VRWLDCKKAMSHVSHRNGRSPVCFRMCTLGLLDCGKAMSPFGTSFWLVGLYELLPTQHPF
jgi:hypothetical protein